MIHMRIVVPPGQRTQVFELLQNNEAVCNLVRLENAAIKPEGDLVLCDVAREEASLLVADLRELDIDRDGSIALEEIDSEISRHAKVAEKASHGRSDPVVWEEVSKQTSEGVELTNTFVIYMALAMMIAAVGIYFDQPILIIGAMVIGPEFGPIAGACVAIVERETDLARRSAKALLVGFPVGIAATFMATFALILAGEIPDAINYDTHTLTRYIVQPNFFSFYVALIAGVAGILSLTSAKSSVLVGVLISVATIPAGANIGVALAYADWANVGLAALQLAINLGAIFAGGLLTLFIQKRLYAARRTEHLRHRSRRAAGLPLGASRRDGTGHSEELDPR